MENISKGLQKLLEQQRTAIITRWFDLLTEAYPAENQKLLKSNKGQFNNPVGYNIKIGLEGIYEELIHDMDKEKLCMHIDKILRIKAVQDFSPADALLSLFILKKAIRGEIVPLLESEGIAIAEYINFEDRIDHIALLGFNIYVQCKEIIYQMRLDEVKKRCNILEKVNLAN
jgi:hypothetical protein